MNKEQQTRKRIATIKEILFNTAVLIILIISIFASSVTAFASGCHEIRQDVLRLHILANSNSSQDQRLKLLVRDEILRLDGELFSNTSDKENAKEVMSQNLDKIKKQADLVLFQNGSLDKAKVELVNMYFTTREYDSFVLPAGQYDALRITIGEAQGENWWCVLYPPLCIPAASEEAIDILSDEELSIIEGGEKYEFKFAIVELIEKIKNELLIKNREKTK